MVKNNFIFCLFFLFLIVSEGLAQSSFQPESFLKDYFPVFSSKPNEIPYMRNIPLDSTVTVSSANSKLRKTNFAYNSNYKIESISDYERTPDGKNWVLTAVTDFTYDNRSLMIGEILTLYPIGGSPLKVYESIFQYDSGENLIGEEYYSKNETDNTLSGDLKISRITDDLGNIKELIISDWDTIKNFWKNKEKYLYEFDTQGRQVLSESHYFINNKWINDQKTITSYNSAGKIIAQENFVGAENAWVKYSKIENVYEGDHVKEEVYSVADNGHLNYIGHLKTIFSYNSNRITSYIQSIFDKNKNEWNNACMYEYIYDQDGNMLINHYSYNDKLEVWDNNFQTSFLKNKGNTLLEIEKKYKDQENKWIGITKSISRFDGRANLISKEFFYWEKGGWKRSTKEAKIFNDNNGLESEEKFIDNDNETPKGYTKNSHQYQKLGFEDYLQQSTEYVWNSSNWEEKETTLYYYNDFFSSTPEINSNLQVYWAPDNYIHINSDAAISSISVFNMVGRQIFYSPQHIDLISTMGWEKGVYLIRLNFVSGKWETKKILVN